MKKVETTNNQHQRPTGLATRGRKTRTIGRERRGRCRPAPAVRGAHGAGAPWRAEGSAGRGRNCDGDAAGGSGPEGAVPRALRRPQEPSASRTSALAEVKICGACLFAPRGNENARAPGNAGGAGWKAGATSMPDTTLSSINTTAHSRYGKLNVVHWILLTYYESQHKKQT